MKKLLMLGVVMVSLLGFKANAQIRLGVNINVGSQPAWGPSGYDRADYYYLPDVDAYYNVPQRQFVYLEGNNWVFRSSLPARYRNYDLYSGYKVVVNEPRPYLRNTYYRTNYSRYRNWSGPRQVVIRDRPGNNGRGNAYGHDKDKGRGHDNRGRDDHRDHRPGRN